MGKQHKNGQDRGSETTIVVSQREIEQLTSRLAREIENDYQGKDLVILGVLKGAFVFMADLIRKISLPLTCDFIRVSSYGPKGTQDQLRLEFDMTQPVKGRNVLLLEDVVDTGQTLRFIEQHLKSHGAKSIRFVALVQKRRSADKVPVDYLGKIIPDDYVVGYGMDLDGHHRNLPWIQAVTLTKL